MFVRLCRAFALACSLPLGFSSVACHIARVAQAEVLVEHEPTVHWLPSAECLTSESGEFVFIDEAMDERLGPRLYHGLQAYWEDCAGTRHDFIREGEGALFAHVPTGHIWYITVNMSGADLGDDEVLALLEALQESKAPGLDLYRTFAWCDKASEMLARCEHLEGLRLGWSHIHRPPDTGALVTSLSASFRRLTRLRELELLNFPPAELTMLMNSVPASVEHLTLEHVELEGEALQGVLDLPRLCWLKLRNGVDVSTAALATLLAKPSMRRFDERWLNRLPLRDALNGSALRMLSIASRDLAQVVLSARPEALASLEGLAVSVDELEAADLAALLNKTPRLEFLGLYDLERQSDMLATILAADLPDLQICGLEGELDANSIGTLQQLLSRESILRVIVLGPILDSRIAELIQASAKGMLWSGGSRTDVPGRWW